MKYRIIERWLDAIYVHENSVHGSISLKLMPGGRYAKPVDVVVSESVEIDRLPPGSNENQTGQEEPSGISYFALDAAIDGLVARLNARVKETITALETTTAKVA